MKPDEVYDMLKKFLGYGNPYSKYWFIGMEENWGISCCSDITQAIKEKDIEYYSKEVQSLTDNEEICSQFTNRANMGNTFESGIKRILEKIEKKKIDKILPDDMFFATNIRFMPVRDDKKIKEFFHKYKEDEKDRRKSLFEKWRSNQHNERITFCLSKTYKENFKELFNNEIEFIINKDKRIGAAEYNGKKIYLLDHPSAFGYFNKCINELENIF
uniref:Uncharacterized protein n=1 Tax=Ignavibacterium album TaxID=591197 RepID=A0A832G6M0_9BACT